MAVYGLDCVREALKSLLSDNGNSGFNLEKFGDVLAAQARKENIPGIGVIQEKLKICGPEGGGSCFGKDLCLASCRGSSSGYSQDQYHHQNERSKGCDKTARDHF